VDGIFVRVFSESQGEDKEWSLPAVPSASQAAAKLGWNAVTAV
jgi:hypothetical protein